MDKILVSACLLGEKCTYKGGDNAQNYFEELNTFYDLVPFCCEVEGGLSIPRLPSEIKGNAVINSKGLDVTSAFRLGVYKASSIVSYLGIRLAILKENSPSCGVHMVHDGYFRDRLIPGEGLLTRELKRLGVHVMNEEEGRAFLEHLKQEKSIKDEKTQAAIDKENAPKSKNPRAKNRAAIVLMTTIRPSVVIRNPSAKKVAKILAKSQASRGRNPLDRAKRKPITDSVSPLPSTVPARKTSKKTRPRYPCPRHPRIPSRFFLRSWLTS